MALQRARFQQHQSSSVLLTVQGPTRAIDLQLPTDIPVGELIPLLLPMCATQEENHPGDHKPVWVLGIEGQPPFGRHETLMSHNITDGTTLWLTDFNAPRLPIPVPEVTIEPPVADIPVEVTDRIRWKSLIPYMAIHRGRDGCVQPSASCVSYTGPRVHFVWPSLHGVTGHTQK
ncbi:hypothetical protein ALPO108162_04425 [Alicyclobacillus pomorum]